jgi:hypothetical protein
MMRELLGIDGMCRTCWYMQNVPKHVRTTWVNDRWKHSAE